MMNREWYDLAHAFGEYVATAHPHEMGVVARQVHHITETTPTSETFAYEMVIRRVPYVPVDYTD